MTFAALEALDRRVAAVERAALILLIGSITVVMMAQVLLRTLRATPIFWAEEMAVQMLVAATLLGMSLLVHHGKLVAVDFLPHVLPARGRLLLSASLGTVLLGVFAFIAWLSWLWIAQPPTRLELSATTQLPRWYNYATLPVAASFMTLHQTVATAREWRRLVGRAP